MQFHFTEPQTDFEKLIGGYFYINAVGAIKPNDDVKFQKFLKDLSPPPRTTVYIDSEGGDVDAAIGIGRLIRKHWFSCSVGRYMIDTDVIPSAIFPRKFVPGLCMSAATLMYIGGRLRYFKNDSTFGIHQFSFRNPSPDNIAHSQVLSARIAVYMEEMGVSSRFLEISSSTASTAINRLPEEQLKELGIVTGGQTEAEWTTHSRNNTLYVRGERDSLFGHHKVMLCYARGAGFIFWAVIESQGREAELTGFGAVEVVINGEETRLDISKRCDRAVIGNYVNVVSRISEEEAKKIAFSDSFGVQIRMTGDADVFLGVAAISTESGRDQLQTFFNTLCLEENVEWGTVEAPRS